MAYFAFEPIRYCKNSIFLTYDLQCILINIKNVKGVHYSWHLDVQFAGVFMTVSHSAHILLNLEKCILLYTKSVYNVSVPVAQW